MIFLALFCAAPVRAEGPDDEYLRIFGIIEKADTLNQGGQAEPARAKYQEAQIALLKLRRDFPNWNTKAVSYRINYVTDKIAALTKPKAEAKPGAPSSSVKLLDAGSEPRKAMRLQVKAGEKQAVEITVKMAKGVGAVGSKVEMTKLPEIKMTFGLAPKSVAAGGDIEYELVVEDVALAEGAGLPPELIKEMKAEIDGIKGLQIVATISDHGARKKGEVKIQAGASAEVRESMEQTKDELVSSAFVLPEEPIGAGARWEFKERRRTEGAMVDETTTYQLVALEADLLTVKTITAGTAASQKIPNPVMPQAKADLVKMSSLSTADVTIDLARIFPSRATAQELSEMTLKLDLGGQKQTLTMKNESNVQMETK